MNDKFTVQMVIGFLGAAALLLITIMGLTILLERHPTDVEWTALATTTGAALAALGTVLVSTHSSPPEPPADAAPPDEEPT